MNFDDFRKQCFQSNQQLMQQQFEHSENQRLIANLWNQNSELIRALKNYNDLVEEFYQETKKKNEENDREMKRIERYKNRLTLITIIINIAGIAISALVSIGVGLLH